MHKIFHKSGLKHNNSFKIEAKIPDDFFPAYLIPRKSLYTAVC